MQTQLREMSHIRVRARLNHKFYEDCGRALEYADISSREGFHKVLKEIIPLIDGKNGERKKSSSDYAFSCISGKHAVQSCSC